jgi:hypothetical protein
MNKSITLLIILVVGLGSFYLGKELSKTTNIDRGGVISYDKNADSAVLFEKQKSCAESKLKAREYLDSQYTLLTPYFYDLFYSPKTGTCIITYGLLISGESPNEIGSFIIDDYFTSETLEEFQYWNSSDDESLHSYNIRPSFTQKVEEYKNY